MHHLERALAAGDRGQKGDWVLMGLISVVVSPPSFTLWWVKFLLLFLRLRWGEPSNVLPFLSLAHPKLCKYLRCSACFRSPCQTAAALPAPSSLLCVLTTGIWEAMSFFPGSSGDGGGREFQGASSSALPASKYAVHLLEGKNKAALFNFWKKPDDSGRGQKYAYQPSPSHCLSCCFLRDRNMWLLKIHPAKRIHSLPNRSG